MGLNDIKKQLMADETSMGLLDWVMDQLVEHKGLTYEYNLGALETTESIWKAVVSERNMPDDVGNGKVDIDVIMWVRAIDDVFEARLSQFKEELSSGDV